MVESIDHHLSAVKMFFKARGAFLKKDKFDGYLSMPEVRAEISKSICDKPDFPFAKDVWSNYKQEFSNDLDFLSQFMARSYGRQGDVGGSVVQEMHNDIKVHAIAETATKLCNEILSNQSGDSYKFFCGESLTDTGDL